jgi:hypothetical protein
MAMFRHRRRIDDEQLPVGMVVFGWLVIVMAVGGLMSLWFGMVAHAFTFMFQLGWGLI